MSGLHDMKLTKHQYQQKVKKIKQLKTNKNLI